MPKYATVVNPTTGQRKKIAVGDPNAFAGGFQLETNDPTKPRPAATYQDLINEAFQNPDYLKAKEDYGKSVQALADLQSQIPNYAVNKQKEILANDPTLGQLNAEQSRLAGQLFSQPMVARDAYKDIFDPTKREALIAQSVGNILGSLTGVKSLIQQRQGTAKDQADQALELLKSQIDVGQGLVKSQSDQLDTQAKNITNIVDKLYQAEQDKVKRQQSMEDYQQKRLFSEQLIRSRSKSDGSGLNKKLTISEITALNNMGIPAKIGDTAATWAGAQPGSVTKTKAQFLNDFQSLNPGLQAETNQSLPNGYNPNEAYSAYLQAQQELNLSKDKQGYLNKVDPRLRPLLKVNSISADTLSAILGIAGSSLTQPQE